MLNKKYEELLLGTVLKQAESKEPSIGVCFSDPSW